MVDGDSGEIIVTARYPRDVDRDEADTWEIYVKEGVDPDPDVDEATDTASFGWPTVDHLWRVSVDELTEETTYHIVVVVKRDGDTTGEYGESAVTQHTTAGTYDIDADSTSLFGGNEYEIGL